MTDQYILEGTTPVPAPDLLAWAAWFQTADRRVAYTDVTPTIRVSTVFLGLNHRLAHLFDPTAPPLLFETMVFWEGSPLDYAMERYSTWHEAEQGHEVMIEKVRQALAQEEKP